MQVEGSFPELLQGVCSHDSNSAKRFQQEFPIDMLKDPSIRGKESKKMMRRLAALTHVYIVLDIQSIRDNVVQLDDKKEVYSSFSAVFNSPLLLCAHAAQVTLISSFDCRVLLKAVFLSKKTCIP